MTALFDTFIALFVVGMLINIATLGTFLVVRVAGRRGTTLPRAIANPGA